MTTDSLDQLVGAAAPIDDRALAQAVPAAAFGDLAHAVVLAEEAQAPARARRPRRRWLVAALAGFALVSSAAAFGDALTARTGWFGNAAYSEEDGSEWLRLDAPDFRAVAAGLVPDVALPAGARWSTELDRLAAQGRATGGLMQETGVRSTLEAYARCAWLEAWRHAHVAGDGAAARRAAEVVVASASWPATAATDGGGVRERIREVGHAAAGGDARTVRDELAVNCAGFALGGVR